MILADSSVWIDHFRKPNAELVTFLQRGLVTTHPFVIGELALGQQKQQQLIIEALGNMRQVPIALDAEVLAFVQGANLAGSGIGYVDAHLLVSAKLARQKIWTRDKKLLRIAARLKMQHLEI